MNHFKTFLKFSLLFCFLPPFTAQGTLNRLLNPEEISLLEKNVKTNPENVKSRLFLGGHHSQKKHWSMVIKWLTPVVEKLPVKSVEQLIEAHVRLSHFREADFLVDGLLSKKKVKTKTYIFAIRTYSDLLTGLPDTPILVPVGTSGSTSKITEKPGGNKQKAQQTKESRKNQEYEVAYGLEEKTAREKIFDLLKQAQNQDPKNIKIYDLWFEMLEKHIANYASESQRIFEDMKANKIKLRKRHYSKLCKYNSLSNLMAEAKEICHEAIEKDPENPHNYIYLGQVHMETGEKEKGRRILASVGKKFSQSEEALWVTAKTYYENNDIVSAYKYYLKASQHRESKPRDFLGLAKTAFELKKYNISLKAFSEHCQRSHFLHQEFRRASGLLKENPSLQKRFRQKMQNCKSKRESS